MIALTTKQAIRGLMRKAAKGKKGLMAIDAKRKLLVVAQDAYWLANDSSMDDFFKKEFSKLDKAQHKINLRLGLVQKLGSGN